MGFRFYRRVKIFPGVTVNIGKKGITGISVGKRGAHVTVGKAGVRTTVGIPGTGISYTTVSKKGKHPDSIHQEREEAPLPYLKQCPWCGHRCRKRWDKCPACGHTLEQPLPEGKMKCPGCGAVMNEGLNYCPCCGREFHPYPGGFYKGFEGTLPEEEKEKMHRNHLLQCKVCHAVTEDRLSIRYCPYCGTKLHALNETQTVCYFLAALVILFLCWAFF